MLKQKYQHPISLMTQSILIVCLLSLATAATAMEIGRLFFSPHERDLMNRTRSAPFSCLKVTGVVAKIGQEQIIWTNRTPESSLGARTDGVTIEPSNDTPTSVQVRIDTDDSVTLRPGQTLDVIGRSVHDGFDTRQRPCIS